MNPRQEAFNQHCDEVRAKISSFYQTEVKQYLNKTAIEKLVEDIKESENKEIKR